MIYLQKLENLSIYDIYTCLWLISITEPAKREKVFSSWMHAASCYRFWTIWANDANVVYFSLQHRRVQWLSNMRYFRVVQALNT